MKKVALSLCFALFAVTAASANSFQVVNYTNCTYEMSTQAGYLTVTPMGSPGSSYFFPTGNYFAAKIMRDGIGAYQINVGTLPVVPSTSTTVYSTVVGDTPACNGGTAYMVIYSVNAAGDILILIMP